MSEEVRPRDVYTCTKLSVQQYITSVGYKVVGFHKPLLNEYYIAGGNTENQDGNFQSPGDPNLFKNYRGWGPVGGPRLIVEKKL